jgi:hypothetical protein
MRRLLRTSTGAAAVAVLAALALGGCGDSHTKVSTGTYAGESGANAPYLDVGPLTYEVQLSRQLNPTNSEDQAYLKGLTVAQRELEPGQEWFGVFIQVYNNGEHPAKAAETMKISDTQGNVYGPIVPPAFNEYAYRGGIIQPNAQIPPPDTTAYFGPTQGALLLFKIKVSSLDNRPLEIKITNPEDLREFASAELDV